MYESAVSIRKKYAPRPRGVLTYVCGCSRVKEGFVVLCTGFLYVSSLGCSLPEQSPLRDTYSCLLMLI